MNASAIPSSPHAAGSRMPGAAWLLFAVFGAPLAWICQLVADYALAAYACFPDGTARSTVIAGWSGDRVWLFLVSIIAVAIGIASLFASWQARARARGLADKGVTAPGRVSRTRSLAIAGLLSSAIFLIAMLFTIAALIRVPQCSG